MLINRYGYNPTGNQAEFDTPGASEFGQTVQAADKLAKIDILATRHPFLGWAGVQYTQPANFIPLPTTHGYRGILPMALIPQLPVPFPYELGGTSANGFA